MIDLNKTWDEQKLKEYVQNELEIAQETDKNSPEFGDISNSGFVLFLVGKDQHFFCHHASYDLSLFFATGKKEFLYVPEQRVDLCMEAEQKTVHLWIDGDDIAEAVDLIVKGVKKLDESGALQT